MNQPEPHATYRDCYEAKTADCTTPNGCHIPLTGTCTNCNQRIVQGGCACCGPLPLNTKATQ